MKTFTVPPNVIAALRRRIRTFYKRLNQHLFEHCFTMVDPQVRGDVHSITLLQYTDALRRFAAAFAPIRIDAIEPVRLHIDEPNELYGNRDFAIVSVTWEDRQGETHVFKERWVKGPRSSWYTRSTGFVVPDTAQGSVPPHDGACEPRS